MDCLVDLPSYWQCSCDITLNLFIFRRRRLGRLSGRCTLGGGSSGSSWYWTVYHHTISPPRYNSSFAELRAELLENNGTGIFSWVFESWTFVFNLTSPFYPIFPVWIQLYLDPLHYFLYTVSLVDILSLFQTQDLVNLQHHVIREKKLAEKETLVIFYNVIQVR